MLKLAHREKEPEQPRRPVDEKPEGPLRQPAREELVNLSTRDGRGGREEGGGVALLMGRPQWGQQEQPQRHKQQRQLDEEWQGKGVGVEEEGGAQ